MPCDIAQNLNNDALRHIRTLEQALGLTIIAFRCRSLAPEREEQLRAMAEELGITPQVDPALPDEEQLQRIREAEEELGVSLIAVRTGA